MTSGEFTIVIPNYNGATILRENLPKIIQLADSYSARIIIVDDASRDESIQILQQQFMFKQEPLENDRPSRMLICKSKNEGFSSTVNLGVRHALTKYVLLLNSDAVPMPETPKYLMCHFEDPQVFSVGMKDIDEHDHTHGQGRFIWHRGFLLHQKAQVVDSSQTKYLTGWVSCGSGMFRKDLWDKLGGLETLFNPFYFEDVDLGYRATKLGYQNYFEPNAPCQHLHHKGAIKSNYPSNRILTISYRNQFFFTWLNLTDMALIFSHLVSQPLNLLIALKSMNLPFLKGYFQALVQLPIVLRSRNLRTTQTKLTDRQILSIFD